MPRRPVLNRPGTWERKIGVSSARASFTAFRKLSPIKKAFARKLVAYFGSAYSICGSSPPPMPVPMITFTSDWSPHHPPAHHSPRTAACPSYSMNTGSPSSCSSAGRRATSRQPFRFGAHNMKSVSGSSTAGTPTPAHDPSAGRSSGSASAQFSKRRICLCSLLSEYPGRWVPAFRHKTSPCGVTTAAAILVPPRSTANRCSVESAPSPKSYH